MKRKIFLNMSYIALITVVCTTVFLSVVAYGRYMSQVKEGIQNEAGYMAESGCIQRYHDQQDHADRCGRESPV